MQKITLVFATNNAHKAREIEQILGPAYTVKTLKDIGCAVDIPETEDTLEGNALIKARYVKDNYGFDCFSEDTGLEVDALDGAPGVITARYAGDQKDPEDNMDLLLENLKNKSNRKAQFRTVIALIQDGKETLFEGICRGEIAAQQRGTQGFGYDPIFIPDGYKHTFAELGDSEKHQISHRAHATRLLVEYLQGLQ
ncbi:MAG: non-canonical purine NTP diphosphatase [Lewinellaceae bacterium]|nr:non-canonical purine NTP diphosphatase [Lewinellaceae bacterium]